MRYSVCMDELLCIQKIDYKLFQGVQQNSSQSPVSLVYNSKSQNKLIKKVSAVSDLTLNRVLFEFHQIKTLKHATTDPINHVFTSCHSRSKDMLILLTHCMLKLATVAHTFFFFFLKQKIRLTLRTASGSEPSSTICRLARPFLSLSRMPIATSEAFNLSKRLHSLPHHWQMSQENHNKSFGVGNFGFLKRTALKRLINHFTPCISNLAKINDEAVSTIEAGPRHIDLSGPNGTSSFNVKQTLHVHVIGHHMLEPRGHTSLL